MKLLFALLVSNHANAAGSTGRQCQYGNHRRTGLGRLVIVAVVTTGRADNISRSRNAHAHTQDQCENGRYKLFQVEHILSLKFNPSAHNEHICRYRRC